MTNLTDNFHYFPDSSNELNRLDASSEFISGGQLYDSRGLNSTWPDGEVVNMRKEPISIDLQVHGDYTHKRSIRQAPIINLDRKIAIPKDGLDLYYSVCEPENIHIKSLTELQRERDFQNKIFNEKQQWQKNSNLHDGIVRQNTTANGEANYSKQSLAPTRKLISDHTVQVQLDGLGVLPENLVSITTKYLSPNSLPLSETTEQPSNIPSDLQRTLPVPEVSLPQGLDRNSPLGRGSQNREGPLSASSVVPNRRTSRERRTGVGASCNSLPPYSSSQRMQGFTKIRRTENGVVLSNVKVEPDTSTLPFRQDSVQSNSTGCPTPTRVVSRPPSPPATSQRQTAGQFWRSHSAPNNLHSQVSLTRLEKLSDKLTGCDESRHTPCAANRRPVVSDVLNLSQEELAILSQPTHFIKTEPVVPTTTPPDSSEDDSSDDDIIWDDEIVDSEATHPQHNQPEHGVLDIHADEMLSDCEYLLDRADELLQ